MRRAEPDDQRFTEFTDHWIRRDIRVDTPDERKSYEIEPVFPDEFAALSRGERAYYRARALSVMSANAPSGERSRMRAEAMEEYENAIENGYDTANAWYYLAKLQKTLGKSKEATESFETAYRREPTHRDAAYAVGQARLDGGQAQAALTIFRSMLENAPDDAPVLGEAGRAAMALGDAALALEYFRSATRLEPWSASLRLNRGRVLASLDRLVEAADQGERAARWKPDDPVVWDFYENVMRAVGREADATEGRLQRERLLEPAADGR